MSEPENFLSRWSRRKREAVQAGEDVPAPDDSASATARDAGAERSRPEDAPAAAPASAPESPSSAAFDPATLPSLDSIGAGTDIRAFLAPGVPQELSLAALRRAWASDPQIRDFVGLSECAWDFNAPDSMLGFGALEMSDELRRQIVDRIVGAVGEAAPHEESASAARRDATTVETPGDAPSEVAQHDVAQEAAGVSQDDSQNRDAMPYAEGNGIAPQHSPEKADDLRSIARRSHGGALPK